jgi:hypothetical protein
MNINYSRILIAVMVAMFFTYAPLQAAEDAANVRHLSGEIAWIDVKLGKLQLRNVTPQEMGGKTEYRINQNETRVTDPLDKKFLTVEDLQVNQYVTLDVVAGEEDKVVLKIVAEPLAPADVQKVEAPGKVKSVTTNTTTTTTQY